ncbi:MULTISPECIES: polysaccharide pyruvyl transferase family protein [Flavobacterium]|uniref:polysaccharide pyruvyl transferase family protein n=1 Tax=Flavobacterium TaxID=237 RepID=UPI001FCC44A7|nr:MULTISPECIES: polysaccharide pyruvyl transferase family protein [Flavobacterium]UOK41193.1 hypothetical protein LZF87_07625 [Flavobacterium enshiense]
MKLIYYSCDRGNIGDELNVWLWPKIFGDKILEEGDDTAFLGIGSILLENSDYIEEASKYSKKVVFGTGVRSVSERIEMDNSWYVSFLRGPFSSLRLKQSTSDYITDGAYYVALLDKYETYRNTPKKYKISVIPYYRSMDKMDWKKLCGDLGWHLITPETMNVEHFIQEVAASEFVISEAMHGAILADVLRVPWKRLRFYSHHYEGEKVSEFKWMDWLFSIEIYDNQYLEIPQKRKKWYRKLLKFYYEQKHLKKVKKRLSIHESVPFYLSSEARFTTIVSQLKAKKEELIRYMNNK